MQNSLSTLKLSHGFIEAYVGEGDICIDATAGRGNDTLFLCQRVGHGGKVFSFDIQQAAVDSTKKLIEENGYSDMCEVLLESHSEMDKYVKEGTVSCITFNFGWLPGGDHNIFTHAETSIAALEKGMRLLKPNGFISACIYYGRETGYAERDALLEYFKTIDSKGCSVLVSSWVNRPNCPPIFAALLKEE